MFFRKLPRVSKCSATTSRIDSRRWLDRVAHWCEHNRLWHCVQLFESSFNGRRRRCLLLSEYLLCCVPLPTYTACWRLLTPRTKRHVYVKALNLIIPLMWLSLDCLCIHLFASSYCRGNIGYLYVVLCVLAFWFLVLFRSLYRNFEYVLDIMVFLTHVLSSISMYQVLNSLTIDSPAQSHFDTR